MGAAPPWAGEERSRMTDKDLLMLFSILSQQFKKRSMLLEHCSQPYSAYARGLKVQRTNLGISSWSSLGEWLTFSLRNSYYGSETVLRLIWDDPPGSMPYVNYVVASPFMGDEEAPTRGRGGIGRRA